MFGLSAIAAIQKEVVDLRIDLRRLFEAALATAVDPEKYESVLAMNTDV